MQTYIAVYSPLSLASFAIPFNANDGSPYRVAAGLYVWMENYLLLQTMMSTYIHTYIRQYIPLHRVAAPDEVRADHDS